MIRPFTCICMLMAAGSGLYLYQTKHRSQMLDREIGRTIRQIEQTRDRIGVLKGEWALLSEPDRLNELAKQHLTLKTLAPTQFVAMTDLAGRLPAPMPPGMGLPPMDEPAPQPIVAARSGPASPSKAAEKAGPDRPAQDRPVQVAALPQPAMPPAAPKPAARPAPAAVSPAAVAAAPARVLPPPQPVAQPSYAPRILAPVMNVAAGPIGGAQPAAGSIGESVLRASRSQSAAPAPQPVQASYGAPVQGNTFGSALGSNGRVALPPPVPYGAGAR